eukprot:768547-Hanusia_phi.AAC.5
MEGDSKRLTGRRQRDLFAGGAAGLKAVKEEEEEAELAVRQVGLHAEGVAVSIEHQSATAFLRRRSEAMKELMVGRSIKKQVRKRRRETERQRLG